MFDVEAFLVADRPADAYDLSYLGVVRRAGLTVSRHRDQSKVAGRFLTA